MKPPTRPIVLLRWPLSLCRFFEFRRNEREHGQDDLVGVVARARAVVSRASLQKLVSESNVRAVQGSDDVPCQRHCAETAPSSINLSIYQFVYASIHLSTYLFIYLSINVRCR